MKQSDNVLEISHVSPDTSRETAAPQQQSNGPFFCIRLTVFVSVLRDVVITSQVK